jgi:hypothetical protein
MKKLFIAFVGLTFASMASGATWYGFPTVGNGKAAYFFDRETVVKQAGSVTIWVKIVNRDNMPDPDGSYATASKLRFNCGEQTISTITEVAYDQQQNHIRTKSDFAKPAEVVPGSVGDTVNKIICSSGFPSKTSNLYVRIGDNDIYSAARRFLGTSNDPAPR